MKNRVAIYARLSREDEDKLDGNKESRSIENQIKILTEYAVENDFEIEEIYYDDGFSGGTLDRPGIQKLLKDIEKHRFNIILVKDISRLGRSLHRVGMLIEEVFPKNNIRLISLNDKYDSSNYDGQESILLRNFLNDYYLKDFKKKCRRSRDFRARTEHLKGFGKFGYVYDEEGNESIDLYSSNVVRFIFNCVGNLGYSLNKTANVLNKNGYMTRSRYEVEVLGMTSFKNRIAKEWDRHSVNDIARDIEYCGHSVNLVRHKKPERILIKNTHQAIIDEELYYRTQKVIAGYKKVGKNGVYNHIGYLIKDTSSDRNFIYTPPRPHKKAKACYVCRGVKGSINADLIHKILIQDCANTIEECENRQEQFYMAYEKRLMQQDNCNKEKLKDELDSCNQAYSKLLEQFFSEKLSEIDFENKSIQLKNKISELEQQINKCDFMLGKVKLFEIKFKRFINNMKNLPNNDLDIIRCLISKVVVNKIYSPFKFDITIVYKFEE